MDRVPSQSMLVALVAPSPKLMSGLRGRQPWIFQRETAYGEIYDGSGSMKDRSAVPQPFGFTKCLLPAHRDVKEKGKRHADAASTVCSYKDIQGFRFPPRHRSFQDLREHHLTQRASLLYQLYQATGNAPACIIDCGTPTSQERHAPTPILLSTA